MAKEKIADWSMGEAMGWGSLLMDGHHVRVSGQDVERGTFSHRHHVLHCQKQDKKVIFFLNILYTIYTRMWMNIPEIMALLGWKT